MRRGGALYGTAVWLGAVVGVATLSWVAIDAAGREVTAVAVEPRAASDVVGTAASSLAPSATPSGTPGASPTASPSPVHSSSHSPTTSPTSRPPSAPGSTERRSTAGGAVTVTCIGATVSRWSASPANGWRVEERESTGEELKVEFTGGGAKIEVKARCTAERPEFTVETGTPHD